MWRPLTLTGTALAPAAQAPAPVMGALTARYNAVRTGTVKMSSTRPACPPAKPGEMSCLTVQLYEVTVTVR
jgi:hypothetical protein